MSRQSELAHMIISGDDVLWTEEMQTEVERLYKKSPKSDDPREWGAIFEALVVMRSAREEGQA